MPSTSAAAVADALTRARSVVIGSHVDPDGDAIGSALGLHLALEKAGVPSAVVLASGESCPSTYAFLPAADTMLPADRLDPPSLFVALDTAVVERLGDAAGLARSAGGLIVIDHHPGPSPDVATAYVDPGAPATASLVLDVIDSLGVTIDAAIATCLYAALVTDTGRFSFANTSPAALRTGARLLEAGARADVIHTALYESRSAGVLRLIGRVLERLAITGGAVAWSWIDETDLEETGALPEETENLIDHVRAVDGIEVAFFAKVRAHEVRVSLRAKGSFDVGHVARTFGGGGHRAAAGFTQPGSLDDTLRALMPLLPGGEG